jgi:hypothetical protein
VFPRVPLATLEKFTRNFFFNQYICQLTWIGKRKNDSTVGPNYERMVQKRDLQRYSIKIIAD